ncbi:ribosomal RNA small subunit methyltransferase I [Geobacter sp. OR-1]|uniref:16S rRNA (cytidine(1402)-2'-O)-methyltransferase n=1 Tax=Geobacter sp. OR-1 TaxID=1266765 RepID=UPI000543531C|nr:16S rRNA (cytidine(1402)-2'-O)-methyltransferase [Geobacter sp. OR-1]GAM11434.1 ribosomal RNA small subunit methyltransferase I [Geobacter sp. OR-1]
MPAGTLYIVATPIGNLEDMTFRAVRILKEVDLIAAEDTRHSRKLLSHFGISTPLTAYHDHNETLKSPYLIEKLKAGQSIAIVTDAGTPCIADPGYRIVRAAAAEGITVVPIPGASATIAALSASGLPTDEFTFAGFLPSKSGKRRERLQELQGEPRLLVFYEAPHRLTATLADMAEVFGPREAIVCRELTKIYEEFNRGLLLDLVQHYAETPARGEVVILVAPGVAADEEPMDLEGMLRSLLADGVTVKDAVRRVADATGQPRSAVYDLALRLKQEGNS